MSSTVIIIAGVAIVVYTIARQIMGAPLRAKRLVILPGIITLVGVLNLTGHSVHPSATDVGLIAVGSAIAVAIGVTLGVMMRLERRDGWLWGQLPKRGLWLWAGFFASRGVLVAIAHVDHAHVADGTHAELLVLGLNRVGQALVIGGRAVASGIPFAPESDGSRPLAGLFGAGAAMSADQSARDSWPDRGAEDERTPTQPPEPAQPPPDPMGLGRGLGRGGGRAAGRLSDLLNGPGGSAPPLGGGGVGGRRAARRARRGR